MGMERLQQFKSSWPEGFYNSIPNDVVTFGTKRKHLTVGENIGMDPEEIYAYVIGLRVSQCNLHLQQVLSTELTACPPWAVSLLEQWLVYVGVVKDEAFSSVHA